MGGCFFRSQNHYALPGSLGKAAPQCFHLQVHVHDGFDVSSVAGYLKKVCRPTASVVEPPRRGGMGCNLPENRPAALTVSPRWQFAESAATVASGSGAGRMDSG